MTHMPGADSGEEVDVEREDVEAEDKGYCPLENGSCVAGLAEVGNCESDGEANFDEDEG
jgi:hypothetical protein